MWSQNLDAIALASTCLFSVAFSILAYYHFCVFDMIKKSAKAQNLPLIAQCLYLSDKMLTSFYQTNTIL